ncbi:hypothetical protein GUITHDRAFT_156528, partial [Guillardia theta CCMP2712]
MASKTNSSPYLWGARTVSRGKAAMNATPRATEQVSAPMSRAHDTRAVNAVSIARGGFTSLSSWKRAANQLIRQLYRAKVILGDLVENQDVDPLCVVDDAGDLHNDDIPAEALHAAGKADEDLKDKLKLAENIVRKLYARSMELTQQNKYLREENERLSQLSVERPRSTSGFSEILHEQKTDTKRRDRPFTAGAPLAKKEEIEQRRVMSAEPQLGSRRGARASTDGWELGGQENL